MRPFSRSAYLGSLFLLFATATRASDFADEAFLEFLGSFDDGEGNWLDPMDLMQMEIAVVRDESKEEETSDEDDVDDDDGAEKKAHEDSE